MTAEEVTGTMAAVVIERLAHGSRLIGLAVMPP